MVSLTLLPRGDDKSVISLHFPGWLDFGMMPIGLACVMVLGGGGCSLPAEISA